MKVFMFIGKQVIKKVGRLKKPIIILCAFALFILPITNILLAHPALARKDPSRFSNLKENDQYKFFTYASAMARCFSYKSLAVHTDVDDQMLHDNVVFRTWGGVYTYIGTYPEVKGFDKGGIKCNGTEFQQEAFNTFGISPNELLCYMGYPKNGLEGKNDSNTKHEQCASLGSTNDFTYSNMPENGEENFLNALTALTGYDRNVAEKNAYIKYRKYSDWIKGCVDGEATSKSDNTWKVSVVNTDTKKVDTIYKPKGKTEYLYAGGDETHGSPYKNKPEFSCKSVESELAIAAKKYLNVLKTNAVDTACAGLADKKLKACKDGASHRGDSKYCEIYKNPDEISACKQGQSAKIEAPEEGDGEEEEKNSCGIDGMGWLICPLMTFMGGIADASYSVISQFLNISPTVFGEGSDAVGAKQAWSFFRDIANAIFVLLFLWVIFSQVSSIGISNYGIKKILPKLIVGAVLVNLSFYICQLAVDLSNILGFTLKEALEGAVSGVGGSSSNSAIVSGLGTAVAGILVLTGTVLFAALAVSIPTLLSLMLVLLVVLVILIVRQAAIILLISIAPLAFAAWLLPNTESLFKKWVSMFRGLLMVFPIISLLYGAGKLAGAILMTTATSDPNDTAITMQFAGLAASILPLGATPFVLKSSLNSLGSIGAKIGGLSSVATGSLKNSVMNKSRISDAKNAWKSRSAKKLAERRSGNTKWGRTASNLRGSSSWLKKGVGVAMNPAAALDNSWVGQKIGLSSGAGAAQEAYDKSAMEKAERAITYQYSGDATKALNDEKADKYIRIAAVNQLKGQGAHGADVVANYLRNGGEVDSVSMANALTEMKGSHAGVAQAGVNALNALQSGQSNFSLGAKDKSGKFIPGSADTPFNTLTSQGVSKLSNEAIAKQNADAINRSSLSNSQASEILGDNRLVSIMSQDTRKALESI